MIPDDLHADSDYSVWEGFQREVDPVKDVAEGVSSHRIHMKIWQPSL